MSRVLRILPAADADMDEIALYIARDNLGAALRFYDAVEKTFRELGEHPERWPQYELNHPRLEGLRKRSVRGFSRYLIFYRIEGREVRIIRMLQGSRDIAAALGETST
jgi:toxin ParE1/3/4